MRPVFACLLSSAAQDREEGPLLSQMEELLLRNVKLGKRAADRETLRSALDGATQLRKFKVEDESVENTLMALVPDPTAGCPRESVAVKAGLMDKAEAYLPGRTFDDPVFDAHWGSSLFRRGHEEQLQVKLGVAI